LPCVSRAKFPSLVHRYYDPATEQFLSIDPLGDETGTPYAFTGGDPVNMTDASGLFPGENLLNDVERVAAKVARGAVDVVAVVPYAVYTASYYEAKGINAVGSTFGPIGSGVARVISAPLAVPEALGLGGDVAIDLFKGWVFGGESIYDEGHAGYINPLHSFLPGPLKGPETYLPGLYKDRCGNTHVDFEW